MALTARPAVQGALDPRAVGVQHIEGNPNPNPSPSPGPSPSPDPNLALTQTRTLTLNLTLTLTLTLRHAATRADSSAVMTSSLAS